MQSMTHLVFYFLVFWHSQQSFTAHHTCTRSHQITILLLAQSCLLFFFQQSIVAMATMITRGHHTQYINSSFPVVIHVFEISKLSPLTYMRLKYIVTISKHTAQQNNFLKKNESNLYNNYWCITQICF